MVTSAILTLATFIILLCVCTCVRIHTHSQTHTREPCLQWPEGGVGSPGTGVTGSKLPDTGTGNHAINFRAIAPVLNTS